MDGYTHMLDETIEKDQIKEERLNELGIKLIRFWDEEVFNDIDNVLRVIEITVLDQKKKLEL